MAGRARAINITIAASESEVTLDAAAWTQATQILQSIRKRLPISALESKYSPLPLTSEKNGQEISLVGAYVG